METQEIWKDIVGYEGVYQVSNFGNILSLNYNHTKKMKILKPSIDGCGYKIVSLFSNKRKTTKTIHRLVAIAFIPNPLNKPEVNHINGIKSDNNLSNLEWLTISENCKHKYKIGLQLPNIKSVIDTKSGFVYKSLTEAAICNKLCIGNLSKMLNGKVNNPTNLKYL